MCLHAADKKQFDFDSTTVILTEVENGGVHGNTASGEYTLLFGSTTDVMRAAFSVNKAIAHV